MTLAGEGLMAWETVLCTMAGPLLCVCQAQGSITEVDVLLLPRNIHGTCRWTLSTDDGISIRNFLPLGTKESHETLQIQTVLFQGCGLLLA